MNDIYLANWDRGRDIDEGGWLRDFAKECKESSSKKICYQRMTTTVGRVGKGTYAKLSV